MSRPPGSVAPPAGPPPLRIRWGRVSVLLAVVVLLAALGIRGALADDPRPPRPAAGPVRPAVAVEPVDGAGGCPAEAGATVREAPGPGRTVALTFDDGPGAWTPKVLEVLRAERVPATFFVVGRDIRQHAGALRAVVAAGHLVGNHTWSHRPPSGSWDAGRLGTEIRRTDAALQEAAALRTCWFRPPQGADGGAAPVLRRRGMAMALWSVDTRDWAVQRHRTGAPAADVVADIRAEALAGLAEEHPVLLMHDGGGYRGATVAALPGVIAAYRDAGYTFVRLDGRVDGRRR